MPYETYFENHLNNEMLRPPNVVRLTMSPWASRPSTKLICRRPSCASLFNLSRTDWLTDGLRTKKKKRGIWHWFLCRSGADPENIERGGIKYQKRRWRGGIYFFIYHILIKSKRGRERSRIIDQTHLQATQMCVVVQLVPNRLAHRWAED